MPNCNLSKTTDIFKLHLLIYICILELQGPAKFGYEYDMISC